MSEGLNWKMISNHEPGLSAQVHAAELPYGILVRMGSNLTYVPDVRLVAPTREKFWGSEPRCAYLSTVVAGARALQSNVRSRQEAKT